VLGWRPGGATGIGRRDETIVPEVQRDTDLHVAEKKEGVRKKSDGRMLSGNRSRIGGSQRPRGGYPLPRFDNGAEILDLGGGIF